MTAADRKSLEVKRHAQDTRVRALLIERHEVTMQFMRAARDFRMSVRGSTVLHVARCDSDDVTNLLQEALRRTTVEHPRVITASSVSAAKAIVDSDKDSIRVVVIEADIDYPGEGILLAKWVKNEHPEVPLILATDNESNMEVINDEIPYVDVFYSRTISAAQLIQLLGCSSEATSASEAV